MSEEREDDEEDYDQDDEEIDPVALSKVSQCVNAVSLVYFTFV